MTETRVEVVVTVPEELPRDLLVPTAMRTTLGVLVDLIANSQRHVILASPFFQLASTLTFGPLGLALHAAILRNVLIDIVSTSGSFSSLDLSQLSPTRVPTSIRLSQPKANLIDSEVLGSHAKLCLVDHKVAYIGSANFTENGLTKHFEVGTLVRGRPAQDLWSIIERLFGEEFFSYKGWLRIESTA